MRAVRWSERDDRGSAIIEFLVIGILVIVPLAYIAMCVMRVQAASVASSLAVREAGRAFVSAESAGDAGLRSREAARIALADQGFELPARALTVRCPTGPCLQPDSTVQVQLDWSVDLPWVPDFLGEDRKSVRITASRTMPVDAYRGEQ